MRILIVGFPDSIHVAKWVRMISGRGWDVHLFPVSDEPPHPELRDVTFYDLAGTPLPPSRTGLRIRRILPSLVRLLPRPPIDDAERAKHLARLIRTLRPDVVHSHEFQHAGYLTLDARQALGDDFPTWMVTNWGSDIYLFGQLPEHANRIEAILRECDYYTCECERDVALARRHGLRGEALPVVPIGGGYDLDYLRRLRAPGPTSSRRTIALKGYQGWAGRAMVGLRAIELCGQALAGYRLALYLAIPDVVAIAEILCHENGVELEVVSQLPASAPYDDILRMQGRSRVSIGLSISDAISTSFLETILLGSFPIQSNTGCADEWIEEGVSGVLVHPEDPDAVARALREAIGSDEMVDRACAINDATIARRLAMEVVQPKVVQLYEHVVAQGARR